MVDDPDLSGLDDDPPDEYSPRLNIDEPFSIHPALSRSVDTLIEAEQWLLELGVREIITGIGSADEPSFMNGVRGLKRILETQFTAGRIQGREDTLRREQPKHEREKRLAKRRGFLIGVSAGLLTAVVIALVTRWAIGI